MASEKEKDKWVMLGEICERESLGGRFQKEAGELYAGGQNDNWAGHLRAISRELLLSAKQMREDYDKKYPK